MYQIHVATSVGSVSVAVNGDVPRETQAKIEDLVDAVRELLEAENAAD